MLKDIEKFIDDIGKNPVTDTVLTVAKETLNIAGKTIYCMCEAISEAVKRNK